MSKLENMGVKDRRAFRKWLKENDASTNGIWLVYYKKHSGKPSILYPEAVKEALYFGWIDSKVNMIDDQRYMQAFTPRKPKSVWSDLNKRYVGGLLEQNLMTPAGLRMIEIAKSNGQWESLDKVEALEIPHDLAKALIPNSLISDAYLAST